MWVPAVASFRGGTLSGPPAGFNATAPDEVAAYTPPLPPVDTATSEVFSVTLWRRMRRVGVGEVARWRTYVRGIWVTAPCPQD